MQEKIQDKSECLKRAAEIRRFARETADSRSPLNDAGSRWPSRSNKTTRDRVRWPVVSPHPLID